ncbi:MAG: aminopeptidase [Betaproteobacteria bacterium]
METMGSGARPTACLRQLRAAGLAAAALLLLGGCSTAGYYAQAVGGHVRLMTAARPVEQWLADPTASADLKQRLELAQRIRRFAADELGLPDNASYTAYANLGRPAVVWNVFATPELSLQLKSWCYPVLGCASYRGYFAQADAQAHADALRAAGYDVNVVPVPAYSTLGWTNWLGGDPLLSTFIHWPEAELARLIFHELAHQVVYVSGDTVFNESFATAVERAGLQRWIEAAGRPELSAAVAQADARRADFLALLLEHRQMLVAAYSASVGDDEKRIRKRAVFEALQATYQRLRADRWGGFSGYDRFFNRELNGAHLAAVAAYNDLVPAFEALLAQQRGDLRTFFVQVQQLARLPETERRAALARLTTAPVARAAH